MNKIVPLISSGVAGPLGALHLPRLWLKVSLASVDKLADGYPAIGNGFDMMVIEALGLTADAVTDYIGEHHPTYPQFEEWIIVQKGSKTDEATIEKLNRAIRGYNHGDDTRKSILVEAGIDEDKPPFLDAVNLNNLDDWAAFHDAELD
ncbi:MAG: DUF5069 domain-containing protein [Luteolibacter sp.]